MLGNVDQQNRCGITMPIGSLSAKDEKISAITEGSSIFLQVPRYQRGYAWDTDNIDEMLSDLQSVPKGSFFFGTLILHIRPTEESTFDLIDGQQRMTSITIMLSVIRDILKRLGHDNESFQIHQHISTKPLGGKTTHRLIPCAELKENDFFPKYIQNEKVEDVDPVNISQKHVQRNKKFFLTWLEENFDSSSPDFPDQILDLAVKMIQSKIILIKVEHAEDAYKIFESVNARGVDLSVADLLKNYLLTHIRETGPNEDPAAEAWLKLQKNVESLDMPITMPKFVRYSWISRYQFDSEKNMYRGIRDKVPAGKCEEFLSQLSEDGILLKKIIACDIDEKVTPRFRECNKVLTNIRMSGTTQYLSFALGLFRNTNRLKIKKPDKILAKVESFIFRYNAVCNLPSNKVERTFSRVGRALEYLTFTNEKELVMNRDKVIHELNSTLAKLNPTSELFLEKFSNINYKTSPSQKLIIRRIFSMVNSKLGTGELTFDTNIEHILPQKPQTWGLTEDEVSDYVNNIGNLTLIQKRLNSKMGNKPFNEKLPLLKTSEIKVNSTIEQFLVSDEWIEASIEERANHLASICDKASNIF